MQIKELSECLKNEGLFKAHVGISEKQYITGESICVNGVWKNLADVFGIYVGKNGRYYFFITDSERGIPEYLSVYTTEEEACEALIKKISRTERIYQKICGNSR